MSLIYPQKSQVATAPKSDVEKLHEYLISRNPEGIKKVLLLHNYNQVTTPDQMAVALLSLVKDKGETAIAQLLAEHPDYEMIVADYRHKHPKVKDKPKKEQQPKKVLELPKLEADFSTMVNLLMFLVLVWLVLKIFKD